MNREERSDLEGSPASLGVFFPLLSSHKQEEENKRDPRPWPSLARRGGQMRPGSRSPGTVPQRIPSPGGPRVPAGSGGAGR